MLKLFWRRVRLSWSLLSALWRENLILGEHAMHVWSPDGVHGRLMVPYIDDERVKHCLRLCGSSEPDDPMYGYVNVLVTDDKGIVQTPFRHKRLYGTVHWNYGGEKP